MLDLKKFHVFAHLSASPSYAVVRRNHKLANYKHRISNWATIGEFQAFGYIKGLSDPKQIAAALEACRKHLLHLLHSSTTKPLRPYSNPFALVKLKGSRVAAETFAEAVKKTQAEVSN